MANDRQHHGADVQGDFAQSAEFLQCVVDVAGRFTIAGQSPDNESDKVVERHAAIADGRVFAPGDDEESVFAQN